MVLAGEADADEFFEDIEMRWQFRRQFRTGTILIRASNRKGEKSLGCRGHAFARVPGLGWHLTPHCACPQMCADQASNTAR